MKQLSIFVNIMVALCSTSNALAGISEVKACGKKLSPPAQLIMNEVLPKLKPGNDHTEVVRSTVINLVWAGELKRAHARENALAAADCLRLMRPK